MAEGCLFCRIAAGEIPAGIVYEDDQVVAFRDINPQAPTHLLLIPRAHVGGVQELRREEAAVAGMLLVRARELAEAENLAATGYRLVVNSGEWAGQTVSHLHLHLLGGRRLGWPPG